ncbi:Putative sirtuin [Klebsormidium nitens]|uniref:Regulatory protein SIR2 homolog 7 n=1 Tax=Klebsormidium nitens TaxID=105231 RepID=A0A1Y1HVS0_KLENI|nr:Putative sirtuin [Klebsormidium nitens]|eukprot:GAQ81081.1 Putative sirtuin [Klebsormidium nitens]
MDLEGPRQRPPPVAYTQVRPSYAHRTLALLVQAGLVKHVVTQNVDGLHRVSGVPREKLSELHGNARMERCAECGREYLRDYATWSVTAGTGSTSASARAKRRRSSERALPFGASAHASGESIPSERPTLPFESFLPRDCFPPSAGRLTSCSSQPSNESTPLDNPRPSDSFRPSNSPLLSNLSSPSGHLVQSSTSQASDHSAHSSTLRPPITPYRPIASPGPFAAHRPIAFTPFESFHRRCESQGCAGSLRHCVTLFREPLPDSAVRSAERETALADAALVLGSSLRVAPACDYPADVAASGGNLAIVNLQPTPLDAKADVIIRRGCDQVMELLLSHLKSNVGLTCGFHEPMSELCESQVCGQALMGLSEAAS